MFSSDRSNFIAYLKEFPDQILTSLEIMKKISFDIEVQNIQHIVLAGMGGSAIAGDLLAGFTQNDIKVPVSVVRDYTVPGFVDQNTLFIATSYSGDTEEVLTALDAAMERSANIIALCSGGQLEQMAIKHQFPLIKIPGGLPPRQALGYLFFPLLLTFEKLGFIPVKTADIKETVKVLQQLQERFCPATSYGNNLANHIAQSIYYAIPIIYAGAPSMAPVTVRWRNQFNENSKSMAFSNVFPELNHNEIMGWEGLGEVNKHFRVIFLRDPEENPRIRQRIEITKNILKEKHMLFGEVFAEGSSRLARLFSLIYTGDWASYYLAMLNEKDPITIDSIDFLKKRLSDANV